MVELIVNGDISVREKNVIDLGCGCGNIGIAAILMGA
jgi:predicted RNA methylase